MIAVVLVFIWKILLLQRTNAHDHQKPGAEPAEIDYSIPSTLHKVIGVCASCTYEIR